MLAIIAAGTWMWQLPHSSPSPVLPLAAAGTTVKTPPSRVTLAPPVGEEAEIPAEPAVAVILEEHCSEGCSHCLGFQLLEEDREAYAQDLFRRFGAARQLRAADADELLRACRLVADYSIQELTDDFHPVPQPEETQLALQKEILGPVLAALSLPPPDAP